VPGFCLRVLPENQKVTESHQGPGKWDNLAMSAVRYPAGLGAPGRRLWRDTTAEFELSAAELALLEHAARVLDDCEALRLLAAGEKPVITGRLGQRLPNPVHVELRAQRRLLLGLLAALHVPLAEAEDGAGPGRLRAVPGGGW
jgi:hypothetical protein